MVAVWRLVFLKFIAYVGSLCETVTETLLHCGKSEVIHKWLLTLRSPSGVTLHTSSLKDSPAQENWRISVWIAS